MNLQKSGFFLTAFYVSKFLSYKFPQIVLQTSKSCLYPLKVVNGTEIQEHFCRGEQEMQQTIHILPSLKKNLYLRGSIPVSLQNFFIRKEGE